MALDANGHPLSRISERKLQHLRLSLEASVQSTRGAGFDRLAGREDCRDPAVADDDVTPYLAARIDDGRA